MKQLHIFDIGTGAVGQEIHREKTDLSEDLCHLQNKD